MRRPFYMVKKWNFDPAATRRARKAWAAIEHAKERILATADRWPAEIDLDAQSVKALDVLDLAAHRVGVALDDALREARLRDEGIIGGRV